MFKMFQRRVGARQKVGTLATVPRLKYSTSEFISNYVTHLVQSVDSALLEGSKVTN